MSNKQYVWECDYGKHSRHIETLKILMEQQSADELNMCALFVNNNPYNLEFFVVVEYEKPRIEEIEKMLNLMSNTGARQRPDIPFKELLTEVGNHRYNAMTMTDLFDLELAKSNLFAFGERSQIAEKISMKPLGKSIPVFLSHASADKPFVEDIIPYLTKRGLPVWYDKISIDYGEGILSAVQSGVQDSGGVLFFITQSFLNSSWCKLEMEGFLSRYAGGQKVLILTIVDRGISREELPFFLQNIKYLKLETEETAQDVAEKLLPVLSRHFVLW